MESVRCWRALGVARWIRPQSDERTRRRQRVLAHRIPMCQPAGQKRSVKLRDAAAKILPYESDRPKLVVWLRDAAAKIPAFENERSKRHGNGARTLPYAKQHGCGAKRIYKTSENGKRRESARIGRQTPMQRELVRRLQNASGEDHIRSLVQSSGPPKTFQVRSTALAQARSFLPKLAEAERTRLAASWDNGANIEVEDTTSQGPFIEMGTAEGRAYEPLN
ncbi:uncharacterized protein LOC119173526 isoform X3 [Rhipicephalus microplus]|uniref:uncharacterized protein LOC119173526 isoform X3 n=1 Tax=Rhipicephalus microplus TaxID=6941 RepID=UPI003F6C9323